ncbi:hypothetical protein H1P_90013 [Hyella patelloides LEGE 07179]|uniref:Uncharacterized protein n=1 Tax=Hyella patelloides LEGE 07179 TaxID=945734 RepID=A0A563W520_9CYAN|nr:hypothetical protein H1P_90013 [Hyella patelloides LEGE 07179]
MKMLNQRIEKTLYFSSLSNKRMNKFIRYDREKINQDFSLKSAQLAII